jgi:hypothetical protein
MHLHQKILTQYQKSLSKIEWYGYSSSLFQASKGCSTLFRRLITSILLHHHDNAKKRLPVEVHHCIAANKLSLFSIANTLAIHAHLHSLLASSSHSSCGFLHLHEESRSHGPHIALKKCLQLLVRLFRTDVFACVRYQHPSSGEHIEISWIQHLCALWLVERATQPWQLEENWTKHFLILLEVACLSTTLAEVRGMGVN